ncbi:MAG: class I SAM-dependent methyltransferase [bacterium]|nr:class I SAM-dependent methyltransferase [bacterium]
MCRLPDSRSFWCSRSSGRALPFADGCFDAVVSLETLYIIAGPAARRECLDQVGRVLRPAGVFVCSVPIEVCLPAVVRYAGRRCARIQAPRITFGKMLRHAFYRFCDLSPFDQGMDHLGFNVHQLAGDIASRFEILRQIVLPLPYPLCPTMMLVCRRR